MQLLLCGKGVPYDVAFALYEHELLAYTVIVGEQAGGQFDWSSMSWMDR